MFSNEQKDNRRLKIGDHVRIKFKGEEGTIIDINGQYYNLSGLKKYQSTSSSCNL